MLSELRVSQLGVIEDVTIVFGPGMTAVTGETGAGKTLLVDAIHLLMGGPAEASLVRPGATEAVVEARFTAGPDPHGAGQPGSPARSDRPGGEGEVILSRVIPAGGRSRGYVDGRMVSAAQLADVGRGLVDIHGQHAHQSLLSPAAQRAALDRFGGISTLEVDDARRRVREIRAELDALGGDRRSRLRELDMLRYQLDEIDAAQLRDADEDQALRLEEETLADAAGIRTAALQAWEGLTGDEGISDRLGELVAVLGRGPALTDLQTRVHALQEEVSDIAAACRTLGESIEDDPARLAVIGARRQLLHELRRKYGDTLAEVIAYGEELRQRIDELTSYEQRAADLEKRLEEAEAIFQAATNALWATRRQTAPALAARVQERLAKLAMPKARFEISIPDRVGSDEVTWLLGANPGEPVLPLTKVASGGELSRTMLAARLAVGPAGDSTAEGGPATLVFDEVDAGVGGEAAVAVGEALAALARSNQVLVVTHLAQVAACADRQLVVTKDSDGKRTVTTVKAVEGAERVVEVSRMLSGSPGSSTARRHAEELLDRRKRPSAQRRP
jgi:DNA repair protein RecN (Recombination protein N)